LNKRFVWLVCFCLGICLVYSLFYAANFFGLSYFTLVSRGMVEQTVVGSIFSGFVDALVWGGGFLVAVFCLFYVWCSKIVYASVRSLRKVSFFGVLIGFAVWSFLALFGIASLASLGLASVLFLVFCLVSSLDLFEVSWSSFLVRVLFGGVLFVLFFEIAALALYNLPVVFNFDFGSSGVALQLNLVELGFSNLAYPFLPYVYLVFVLVGLVGFAVLVLPWQKIVNAFGGKGWICLWKRLSNFFALQDKGEFGFLRRRIFVLLAVLAGTVTSCLFVVFTVLPWANPTGMLVSVDAPNYYQWIVHMRGLDIDSAMGFAFSNDRALFLILAYAFSFVVSPLWVVQFASAFLIAAFIVICFLALRLLCKVREVWVLGVLLAPFSFQALGLIYSGFFANMLALIMVLLYIVLLIRLLDNWSSIGFLALLFVSTGILFSHPWTWFVFALSLLVFLFLEWRSATHQDGLYNRLKSTAVLVGVTLSVGLACDLIRKILSPVSSTSSVLSTAGSSLGLPNFGFLLSELEKSVDFILGGVFANGLLVFLGLVGLLVLFRIKSNLARFLVSWIFVGCVTITFGSKSLVFDRFLFLLPWIILSSLGLFWVLGLVVRVGNWGRWRFLVLTTILIFIFLVLLNNALRYVFNINAW
jgi:hypothetical protein